jgi:hypothetical protein
MEQALQIEIIGLLWLIASLIAFNGKYPVVGFIMAFPATINILHSTYLYIVLVLQKMHQT